MFVILSEKSYQKKYPEGTPLQPTKDEINIWRTYAREELGLESDYLYTMIIDKFRWHSRGSQE